MRVCYLGDVVGRSGREAALPLLARLKEELKADWIFVNVENSAAGFGITEAIAKDFFEAGAHALSTGNHAFDQKGVIPYFEAEPRLLRPTNYPGRTPGKGFVKLSQPGKKDCLVVNMSCRLFMAEFCDCPFQTMEKILMTHKLGQNNLGAIVVDLHGEATSEKQAFARYFDGQVSLVVGTHTHVPTADTMILPQGTGYQTDLGMCGDYNSILGMKPETPIQRFLTKTKGPHMETSHGPGTVSGVLCDIDGTGKTTKIAPLVEGPHLHNHWPGTLS